MAERDEACLSRVVGCALSARAAAASGVPHLQELEQELRAEGVEAPALGAENVERLLFARLSGPAGAETPFEYLLGCAVAAARRARAARHARAARRSAQI